MQNLTLGAYKVMNVKLNKKELENKIKGCWIGKNIGGTIGDPYEGTREMLNITGFCTPKGDPLPNDDLDLQLVWIQAMEKVGPYHLSANILGEYWLAHIAPHWNEYGVGKCNMQRGILPPMSGEVCNEKWKNSNGAWIRSEVWACMAPGFPNIAVKYAIMDACVDHGISEGTVAEVFTAALESIAFVENNIRKAVELALTYIPETSRVYECVSTVLKEYDSKTPYEDTRNKILEITKDMGWYQSPANVGFMTIGLIYGEGDFKKSLLYAVNCGDDTDCTAATCGAVMGIMYGVENIPEDWKEYIGDRILTISINGSYRRPVAKTCTELTQRELNLIPTVLGAHEVIVEYTDDENEYNREEAFNVLSGYAQKYFERSRFSFDVSNGKHWEAYVEYEKEPFIKANEEFKVKVRLTDLHRQTYHVDMQVVLPDGWTADYPKTAFLDFSNVRHHYYPVNTYEFTIKAGENVQPTNKCYLIVSSHLCPVPLTIPITLLG